MKTRAVVEWAPFRLAEGVSEAQLLRASSHLQTGFLAKQRGFVRRELLRGRDRQWADIVFWEDQRTADEAVKAAAESPACQEYFKMMLVVDHSDSSTGVLHFEQVESYQQPAMAEKLKTFFDERIVRSIARDLRSAYRRLDERMFVDDCLAGLDDLEFTARGWRVAEVMHRYLPQPFPKSARAIVASLGPELDRSGDLGLEPLRYMPHVFFVAKYGLDDFEASMAAQRELTKRFSAEWSIRAFLVKYPDATYARLRDRATDSNVHIRRLVSEGTRPRLPWAPRLRAFQEARAP